MFEVNVVIWACSFSRRGRVTLTTKEELEVVEYDTRYFTGVPFLPLIVTGVEYVKEREVLMFIHDI